MPVQNSNKYYTQTWSLRVDDDTSITEEAVRKLVNSQLDQFIEAYKAANPKTPTQPTVKAGGQ